MLKNFKRIAFSMAEVMIVLAIVTVVVAVSVKITKARFDSANRYLYYAAYTTLRDLTNEVHLEVNSVTADGYNRLVVYDSYGKKIENYDLNPILSGVNSDGTDASDNLCKRIANFANLAINGNHCDGGSSQSEIQNAVAQPEKDFSLLTPSLVLRNGMKLYNITKVENPVILNSLTIYNWDGSTNLQQTENARKAYIVYVDIDGERNSSVLWEDVFPFYITLNGYVIPAYNEDGIGGANNIVDIAASVQYDDLEATGRIAEKWLLKSVTYQEAACKAGFVNGSYCSGIAVDSVCQKAEGKYADCRVKIVVPLKF